MALFQILFAIISFFIGTYKWVNGVGLKEPYKSQLEGNYKKWNDLLSNIKEHKEKQTLIKNADKLEKWGFFLLLAWGLLNMTFKDTKFILYFAIIILGMIILGFSINWVLSHKQTIKRYGWYILMMILSPFFLLLLGYLANEDIFPTFEQSFSSLLPFDLGENNWVAASLLSLWLAFGFFIMYLFAWIVSMPITYGTYTILWLFNKYLKITNKYTDNLISAILYILWAATFILGFVVKQGYE